MEVVVCFLIGAWAMKIAVVDSRPTDSSGNTTAAESTAKPRHRQPTRFGLLTNSCFLLIFLAIVGLQLVPLPLSVLKTVSPNTAALYQMVAETHDTQNESVSSHNAAQRAENLFDMYRWRPLSFCPYATKTLLLQLICYIAVYHLIIHNYHPELSLGRRRRSSEPHPPRRRDRENPSADGHLLPIHNIIRTMLVAGFLVALLGVLQYATGNPKVYWYKQVEDASPFGPYINRNHFAGYINMLIPVVLAILILRQDIERPPAFAGQPLRVMAKHLIVAADEWTQRHFFFFLVLILMICSAILSVSRGGAISMTMAYCLFVVVYSFGRRFVEHTKLVDRIVLTILILSIVFSLLWSNANPLFQRFSEFEQYAETAQWDFRTLTYMAAADMIRDYPWTGVGLGGFEFLYFKYRSYESARMTGELFSRTHSDFIQVLTETGIPGFAAIMAFLVSFTVAVFRGLRRNRSPISLVAVAGGMAGLGSMIFHSFVDFNMQIPANAMLFFILAATTYAIANPATTAPMMESRL